MLVNGAWRILCLLVMLLRWDDGGGLMGGVCRLHWSLGIGR